MSASLRTQTRRWGSAKFFVISLILPMKKPIEILFDQVAWEVLPPSLMKDQLHATHSGVLEIGEIKIPCFQLSDGQRVIEEAALEKLFPGWKELFKQTGNEIPPTIPFTP